MKKHAPKQRRSEITRHRVIDAAIEAFGMQGYERTSTRALVERAGTNLVSIHYHFGGKQALYRAAAEHIASTIRERNSPVIERGQAVAADPAATRNELIEAVCTVFDEFVTMALAGGMPECWRKFMVREQVEPSDTGAFEVMFDAVRPLFETVFTLIARLIDRPAEHAEVRLLTTMIFGQVSVFRTNHTAALRLLGWNQFGPPELRDIRTVTRKYIFKLLDGRPQTPARSTGARGRRRAPASPARARTRRARRQSE